MHKALPLLPLPSGFHSSFASQQPFQAYDRQQDAQMLDIQQEEVCFGMVSGRAIPPVPQAHPSNINQLKNIAIQLTRVRREKPVRLEDVGREAGRFAGLSIDLDEDRCDILAQGDTVVGTLNTRTHLALKSLSSAEGLRFLGVVRRAEFEEKLTSIAHPVNGKPASLTYSMALLVVGLRSLGDIVARELSKKRLFLQHPKPMPQSLTYENPQYLTMVTSSLPNGALLPPISVEALDHEISVCGEKQELDNGSDDVIALINNLPRQEYLSQADIDKRITTPLLW